MHCSCYSNTGVLQSSQKTTCWQYVLIHSLLPEFNVGYNGDWAGPFRGTSGTLGREGWGEYCDYSEISV
jgi:hypothetical protein